ncbi:MAG: hypothetical protein J0M19_05080 [Sphingomonadales bacterium]|nr:hypothetical protein [Sphingomonadales bacterium]
MRNLFAACMASALCFTAAPALAQKVTDDEANAMLDAMSTTAFNFCTDSDEAKQRPAMDQYNACQTAIAELAQVRKKNPNPTAGQKEVYRFYESALQMGHTYTMLRVDGQPTARVCGNIENQWVMISGANTAVVGPDLGNAFVSMKDAVRPLVKLCRERFAAPAGALAI